MGGVLFHVMEWLQGIIATAIVNISCELHPSVIQLGMAVEPHTCVHFNDERVEFVQRYKVAYKSLKKWNVVAPGKVHADAPITLVRPIANQRATNSCITLV